MSEQAKEVVAARARVGTGDSLQELAGRFGCKTKGELAALVLERFVSVGGVMPGEGRLLAAVPSTYDHSVPAYAAGSDTSYGAAQAIAATAGQLRSRILGWVASRGDQGATRDEIEVGLGLKMQTVSPRVHELTQLGLLEDSGKRRATRSGRTAAVMVAKEARA